jgi:LacI family transcriptional regulator
LEPREVVVRQSTDTLAIKDPDLHRAVAFIRDRACEGITVKDVMAQIPLSRRQLERRFSARFGHSLGEEIRRVKLDRARKLLLETNLPLPDIAARCGYEYPTYLSRAVKKRFGLGPRALRRSAGDFPIR